MQGPGRGRSACKRTVPDRVVGELRDPEFPQIASWLISVEGIAVGSLQLRDVAMGGFGISSQQHFCHRSGH